MNDSEKPEVQLSLDSASPLSGKRSVRGSIWFTTYVIQIFVLFVLVVLLFGMALTFSEKGILGNSFYTTLDVVTVDEGSPQFEGLDWQAFTAVSMESSDPDLWNARVLFVIAAVLDFATYFAMAGFIFLLAALFRKARPFTRLVRVGLMLIAAGLTVTATLSPWLRIVADQLFVTAVGLPTSGDVMYSGADPSACTVCEWVNYPYYSFTAHSNWLLLALVVVLVFVALSYRQGERLQRDTVGLV